MNRKPLVFVNGEISEMPSGDLVDPAVLPELEAPPAPPAVDFSLVELVNGTPFARPFGTPVYVKPDGEFADAVPGATVDEAEAVGLITNAAPVQQDDPGIVKTHGPMTGTEAQWNAQTGGSGGLVAGSDYYLNTGGGLSTTPIGPNVTKLGKALSSTVLNIRIEPTITVG